MGNAIRMMLLYKHREIYQANSKGTYKALVARRMEMEGELASVRQHKEELLKRRIDSMQTLVANVEKNRDHLLEQLNRQPPMLHKEPQEGEGLEKQIASKDLPSPDEIAKAVAAANNERRHQ